MRRQEHSIWNRAVYFTTIVTLLLVLTGRAGAETDVTTKTQLVKSVLGYDRLNKRSYLTVGVKNISADVLLTPIRVVVDSVTPSTVTVANADGRAADGKPYFLYSTSSGRLQPGEALAAKRWNFANPSAARFSYATHVVMDGKLNEPPVANAGPDQSVYVHDGVTLDGSSSSDVDGDTLTFRWSLVAIPAGSSATLADSDTVSPRFDIDLPGTYVVQLVVNDGTADSSSDTVTISTANSKPVARAGQDQTVPVRSSVVLDGATSSDVDGDDLDYAWTLRSKPSGSDTSLDAADTVNPGLYVDMAGNYVVELVVNDGTESSAPDTVTISTRNSAPVAHAGQDMNAFVGQNVQLDGSQSSDIDGDPLAYQWSFAVKPEGSETPLIAPDTVAPAFVPDLPGLYVPQLIVNDGAANSTPDTAKVQVVVSECLPGASKTCYTGPQDTSGTGLCQPGAATCGEDGAFGACQGEVLPVTEIPSNGLDEDCNGSDAECLPGTTKTCYTGPQSTLGVGICQEGTATCGADGYYGACQDQILPTADLPGNGIDEDCNNMDAECTPGDSKSCYTGPEGTAGVGLCRSGTATCGPDGSYASCQDQILPATEIADNGLDEDCDGQDLLTGEPLPPDPASVAPPVDETVTATVAGTTSFLYSGANPIQTGVAESTIEPKRAAVLRGKITDRDGNPLSAVTITILNHPEFGQTLSRSDGMFDLAVNGGGLLTVNYERDGFLPAQRQVNVPWQEYVWLPEVALIPLDPQTTVLDLASPEPMQVAQGSIVSDSDGTRQATLLVSQGTAAQMVLPDGSTQPLQSLTVRATEYTVGENGPQAMPGPLPPTSGYTYAVELSADEAMAAGATKVVFDRPISFYVDNFLGFPVGGIVPAGYYDRQQGQWIASQNGKVVRILRIASGLAELDTNGDGAADNAATLAALGITPPEQAKLAVLYPQTPKELWRVPITHFTPWDCNWPYGPPSDAITPDVSDVSPPPQPPDSCNGFVGGAPTVQGSIIDCQQQSLGEKNEVTGTPFSLHYRSDRMQGRRDTASLDIPLSGANLPASVKRILLEVTMAGKVFRQSFPAQPNQNYRFEWDGLDAYGRALPGAQPAAVSVGYLYQAVYLQPSQFERAFAMVSGNAVAAADRANLNLVLWGKWTGTVQRQDARRFGLGGWELDVHHAYDLGGRVLYLGNGGSRRAEAFGNTISTVAENFDLPYSANPYGIAFGPDGSLYIADTFNHRVLRKSPDGVMTRVAGTGVYGFSGDGGPARLAKISWPVGIVVLPDASFIFSDQANQRIRKVNAAGVITTIAGDGEMGFRGDGGPATKAQFANPEGIALGPDGSLYIADNGYGLLRRIGPDGIITTVAGGGALFADGIPATQANLGHESGNLSGVTDVAVGYDGSFYVMSRGRIRKVSTAGIITTIAGTGVGGFSGDGGSARKAQIGDYGYGIAVGPDNTIYFGDHLNQRIRRIGSDGIISTIAGNGTGGFNGDGGPATQTQLWYPSGLTIGPDKGIYFTDEYNHRIRRISPPLPGFSTGDFMIPSEDGREVFVFNSAGRHLRTVDSLTNLVSYRFGYDSQGLLVTVTDQENLVTTIERNAQTGLATAIVAPYGQRTTLAMNSDGYLARITNPANETHAFTYSGSGLMASLTDPNGYAYSFEYDATGRLTLDADPAGGEKALTRTEITNGFQVALTTALGRTTTHRQEDLTTGGQKLVSTYPTGLSVIKNFSSDRDIRSQTNPDGSSLTQTLGPDSRFGMQAPILASEVIKTPGGRTMTTATTRSTTLADPNNPLGVTAFTEATTTNGRTFTSTWQAATRTLTVTTPVGRTRTAVLDSQGRIVSSQIAGFTPVQLTYDASGRVSAITQGPRSARHDYDPAGMLSRITDPLLRTTTFTHDPATRLTATTLPNGSDIRFTYDPAANLSTLTPPDRPDHAFSYTPVNLVESYTPPDTDGSASATHYTYNADRQPTAIALPDGRSVAFAYDNAGRLTTVNYSQGDIARQYHAATGNLAAIIAPSGDTVAYTHDGFLVTGMTMSGTASGSIQHGYNNNFWRTSQSVNGGSSVTFQYDQDGLLTKAGALSLTRSAQNGTVTGTSLGVVSDTFTISGFGELTRYQALANGTALFDTEYTRDDLGRITVRKEIVAGTTRTHGYTYDTIGRLIEVRQDGALVSQYAYDANGNRLSQTTPAGTTTATYDDQDRLLTYGGFTYAYNANGDLKTKTRTATGATTSYQYDELGNLLTVTLPDGAAIGYVIDGLGRRIGKKVNGALTQGFLYEDQLRIVAELDTAGNLVSRFVYADKANVPEYMVKDGVTYRLVTDHLGSPRLVIDTTTGAIVQRLDYDEFGNVTLDTNPGFQPFGFAGGLYDGDTGLVRFGVRDYDPAVGRWTAKDPIGFGGGDTNLYGYVQNNSINYVDPSGRNYVENYDVVISGPTPHGYDSICPIRTPTGTNSENIWDRLRNFFDRFGHNLNRYRRNRYYEYRENFNGPYDVSIRG